MAQPGLGLPPPAPAEQPTAPQAQSPELTKPAGGHSCRGDARAIWYPEKLPWSTEHVALRAGPGGTHG